MPMDKGLMDGAHKGITIADVSIFEWPQRDRDRDLLSCAMQSATMAISDEGTASGSEYQVFLSFRGPDTREGFTDVLFHSLVDAGMGVFRDDEELRVGEEIGVSLQRAIDNSKIYIPIFSQNYASSQWCLRELTQILTNISKSEDNKEILPIFFDVQPDDVKLKTALYSDAILNLQLKKELSDKQVDAWRKALQEVGAIKGWEVKKYKGHGTLIKLVVEEVMEKLKTKHRLVTEHLVGIDDRVGVVSKLLDIDSSDVRLIQIHGMGGIGKTTLARVIFNQFSSHFGKCCCFLEDIRAKSSSTNGFIELQKKALLEIGVSPGTRSIDEIDHGMKRIGEALRNKKVLLVLDDVDKSEQVEKLIGKITLYPGSRILITTRNRDVLQINSLKYKVLGYEMEVMSIDHANELFSRHAFNEDSLSDDYKNLAREIVCATGRLPLALEVIGSFLHNKGEELWKETLDKLRKTPHPDVFGKLKISYDALSYEQKQIFLDIACFFIGKDKTDAIYMWRDCGFFVDIEVAVLISMSLVKIVEKRKIWMHDQLRDLGREIVHLENPMNPGERSRIWMGEEVLDAIRTKVNKKVQALHLDTYPLISPDVAVESKEIERFEHLRFLELIGASFVGNLANHLTNLRWIYWADPPRSYKWTNICLRNVVVIKLSSVHTLDDSRLQNLIKMASKLKVLSLYSCQCITKTPDFSGCTDLEKLTFVDCQRMRKIGRSIGKLRCLIELKIKSCYDLEDVPEQIGDLVNLKKLVLRSCLLNKLPDSICKLTSLRKLHFLQDFPVNCSTNSWELPSAIGMLQNLEVLIVGGNYNLGGLLPSGIGSLPFLRILNLSGSCVSEVPKAIGMLPCLQILELTSCHKIQELPALPTSLTHLHVSSTSLRVVPDLSNLTNLVELDLYNNKGGGNELCTGELWWIGRLSKLTKLGLGLHNVPIPTELASLPLLNQFCLSRMDQQTFPQLPSTLQKLILRNFNSIVFLSPNLRNLSEIELSESLMKEIQLDGRQLPHLMVLRVTFCRHLERLRLSSMRDLKILAVLYCENLVEIQFSWVLESLEILDMKDCKSLRRLVYGGEAGHDDNECANELISCEGTLVLPSRALNKLRSFSLWGCHKICAIKVVDTSEFWQNFNLSDCPYVKSLSGLSNLKNLKRVYIHSNKRLQVIEGLDELDCLDRLNVHKCKSLERLIDVSSTKLPNDCEIEISECRKLSGVKNGFKGSIQHFKHYMESKQRRGLGRVSLECLSFNS